MTLANKTFLLVFFSGCCPQMARLKRWVSHGLLLGDNVLKLVSPVLYSDSIVSLISCMTAVYIAPSTGTFRRDALSGERLKDAV